MQSDAFPTPHFKPSVHRFVRIAGPLYMRLALGVKKVVVFNRATLKAELAAFKEGKQRLISSPFATRRWRTHPWS